MREWRNLVPQHVAVLKEQYNRRRAMWVMYHFGGETFKGIADKFGLSEGVVKQHVLKFERERHKPDPIEKHLSDRGGLAELAFKRTAAMPRRGISWRKVIENLAVNHARH